MPTANSLSCHLWVFCNETGLLYLVLYRLRRAGRWEIFKSVVFVRTWALREQCVCVCVVGWHCVPLVIKGSSSQLLESKQLLSTPDSKRRDNNMRRLIFNEMLYTLPQE